MHNLKKLYDEYGTLTPAEEVEHARAETHRAELVHSTVKRVRMIVINTILRKVPNNVLAEALEEVAAEIRVLDAE